MGFHHIGLTVSDFERSKRFYQTLMGALGAAPAFEATGAPHKHDDGKMMAFVGPDMMLTLWEAPENLRAAAPPLYSVGLHHVAFAVHARADVDRVHALAQKLEAQILDAPAEYPYAPGYYAVYFTDPDGMKLEAVYVPA